MRDSIFWQFVELTYDLGAMTDNEIDTMDFSITELIGVPVYATGIRIKGRARHRTLSFYIHDQELAAVRKVLRRFRVSHRITGRAA